eukprot:Pgem_evm1s18603
MECNKLFYIQSETFQDVLGNEFEIQFFINEKNILWISLFELSELFKIDLSKVLNNKNFPILRASCPETIPLDIYMY